jgi:hypothetical protein
MHYSGISLDGLKSATRMCRTRDAKVIHLPGSFQVLYFKIKAHTSDYVATGTGKSTGHIIVSIINIIIIMFAVLYIKFCDNSSFITLY